MKKCYDCTHVEMCGWRKEVEEHGCEFFDDGMVWIPVSERLPDADVPVLVSDGAYVWIDELRDDYEDGETVYWWDSQNYFEFDVTAWMPLPMPYKNEREEYELATEQMEHDAMYEPTYNPEDGSM